MIHSSRYNRSYLCLTIHFFFDGPDLLHGLVAVIKGGLTVAVRLNDVGVIVDEPQELLRRDALAPACIE